MDRLQSTPTTRSSADAAEVDDLSVTHEPCTSSASCRSRAPRRPSSVLAIGIAALSLVGLTSCAVDGGSGATAPSLTSPSRSAVGDEAPPADADAVSVLARTSSQPIASGRLAITVGGHEVTVQFDGGDIRAGLGGSGAEMLVVDGSPYLRNGERWITIPGIENLPVDTATFDASGMIDRIRGVLDSSSVTAPGEPMTVEGVEVTRYRTQLDGKEAVDLFSEAGTAAKLIDGDERGRRILEYGMDHTTVDLVGDVDADGMLRRLEITSRVDGSAYPDCALLTTTGEMTVVLSDIDRPQDIAAPPAESVDSLMDLDPSQLLDGLADQLGGGSADSPGASPVDGTNPLGSLPDAFGDLAGRMGSGDLYTGCPE